MRTFKRKIVDIDTSVNNISKYSNQLTFTGIKQSKNIYEVDQKSQMDTLNVYVNDENTLISREPLVEDTLDIELNGELIDVKETNGVKIYVIETETNYKIIAKRNNEIAELTATEYHLAIFNQYIICFRTEGAVLVDTSLDNLAWDDLVAHTDIPITKITTGNVVQEFDENQLSDKHSEMFIRKKDLMTVLPIDNTALITGKIYNNTSVTTLSNLDKPWLNTNLNQIRILNTPVEIGNTYRITLAFNKALNNYIICMADRNKVHISYDNGNSFGTVFFPTTANRHIGSVSDDGRYYFYVATDGVYRLELDTLAWTPIRVLNNSSNTIDHSCEGVHFVNGENFCFYTRLQGSDWATDTSESRKIRVYYKGVNIQSSSANTGYLCYSDINVNVYALLGDSGGAINAIREYNSIKMCVDNIFGARLVLNLAGQNNGIDDYGALSGWNTSQVIAIFGRANDAATIISNSYSAETDFHINKVTPLTDKAGTAISGLKAFGTKMLLDGESWRQSSGEKLIHTFQYFEFEIYSDGTLNNSVNNTISTYTWPDEMDDNRKWFPYYISTEQFLYERGFKLYTYNNNNSTYDTQNLPDLNDNDMQRFKSAYLSDFIYCILDDKFIGYKINNDDPSKTIIFTNILSEDETVEFTYTYNASAVYDKVPTLSYSGSELFLAFDNTLMITKNTKDGSNILFNLPKINNQDFVDNITNMINISTSELAIFFKNNILICTRQSDETFGYAYTYSKTRLSLGVRLGDDVINTLDGANSIFPTIRGLAIMNYQAYMATTDQMLTFATDDINQLWNEFYSKSSNIKIIQMRNYIYLSNGTNKYLMFDTRTASWWKFEIPFAITKMLTDQLYLNIISSRLYKLDTVFDKNKYIDCNDNHIKWHIASQRLHFGVPNHYKNLKQLIFQLVQSNNFQNTINTEIKLYRKTITYKEPEMIRFKIDEFKTVVKRFNYWKINELQWALSSDNNTNIPAQLVLNGIDIKYEIGEEVR